MRKAHAIVSYFGSFRDTSLFIEKIETINAKLYIVSVDVASPEPKLPIVCLQVIPDCLSLKAFNLLSFSNRRSYFN